MMLFDKIVRIHVVTDVSRPGGNQPLLGRDTSIPTTSTPTYPSRHARGCVVRGTPLRLRVE